MGSPSPQSRGPALGGQRWLRGRGERCSTEGGRGRGRGQSCSSEASGVRPAAWPEDEDAGEDLHTRGRATSQEGCGPGTSPQSRFQPGGGDGGPAPPAPAPPARDGGSTLAPGPGSAGRSVASVPCPPVAGSHQHPGHIFPSVVSAPAGVCAAEGPPQDVPSSPQNRPFQSGTGARQAPCPSSAGPRLQLTPPQRPLIKLPSPAPDSMDIEVQRCWGATRVSEKTGR